MQKVQIFKPKELPDVYKYQVLAFQRIIWTKGFVGKNQDRDWISSESEHPLHFIIASEKKLIGHVEVVWRMMEHCAVEYKTYGLTGVLTYPDFRKMGVGKKLVLVATEYILKSDADLGLFHCKDENVPFYTSCGWEPLAGAPVTLIGDPDKPEKTEAANLMIKFLSAKAKKHKKDFLNTPLYFGDATW